MKQWRGEKESGYVLATTALLLIPLMVFAAFSVDVGGWYVEADKAQRAADAASLAGVVWMPDFTKATAEAREVALANGFDHNDPDIVVDTAARGTQGFYVNITTLGESHFGKVVSVDSIQIDRFAAAEYVLPVPMGNPTSTLGGGTENIAGSTSNFFLRAMSECENRQTGDFVGAGGGCNGAAAYNPADPDYGNTNPNHKNEGHTFIVDIPTAGNWELQARLTCAEFNPTGKDQANAPMTFTLYPADNTNLDDNDNLLLPTIANVTVNRPDTSICADDGSDWSTTSDPAPWVTIKDGMNLTGHYVLHAKNTGFLSGVRSLYTLRVVPSGTANASWACTRIGPSASASCPNIYAQQYLTTYTDSKMFASNNLNNAELYLAEIAPYHAGKELEITLFDPADGLLSLQILDPAGTPVNVEWWTIDCSEFNYKCGAPGYNEYGSPTAPVTQSCSGSPCVKEVKGGSVPAADVIIFQDRTIRMRVRLGPNYDCGTVTTTPNCWWTVRYEAKVTGASETTTWGVRVIGDPVRLTE